VSAEHGDLPPKPGLPPDGASGFVPPTTPAFELPRLLELPSIQLFDGPVPYLITDGGKWEGASALFFQWMRNGQPIVDPLSSPGDGPRYDLSIPRDYEKEISCKVIPGTADGLYGDSVSTRGVIVHAPAAAEEQPDEPKPADEPQQEKRAPSVVSAISKIVSGLVELADVAGIRRP
jgi:hypothetical protein